MDVLNEIENGMPPVDAAFHFRVSESSVSKWTKNKKLILAKAADQHMRTFRKGRPSTKHNKLFEKLLAIFRASRTKGRMVSFKWLYVTASKIHQKANPQSTKPISPSVIVAFICKFKVKNRRVQRRKQKSKDDGVAAMIQWHVQLREGLIKTGQFSQFLLISDFLRM